MEPELAAQRCGNCGTPTIGEYCHQCGQHVLDPLSSVRRFARDVAGEIFYVNSRTWRSLRDLLLHPGLLTATYRAGARVRYLSPLQLYLLAAAVFFVINSWRPVVEFDVASRAITSSLGAVGAGAQLDDAELARFTRRGISLPLFAEKFRSRVNANLPTFLIGSVLLFTLAFRAVYRRQRILAHAVFVLHWTAFYLLLMAADRLLPSTGRVAVSIHALVLALTSVWFLLALRRVYTQSWLMTAGKGVLLMVIFQVILALWVVSVIGIAFATI